MGRDSKIEWCDHTFNTWVGCQKVGPGCDHCYAERWAKRTGQADLWSGRRRRTSHANWKSPHRWNRRAVKAGRRDRVFCASLADVFDNAVPQAWRDDLWSLIRETPALDWIIVTKRIGNTPDMLPSDWGNGYPNVWLMITVVNQEEAGRDVPRLLKLPAAVRGVSIEPQLGAIDLSRITPPGRAELDALVGFDFDQGRPTNSALDWVICGCESGPQRRHPDENWFRSLRDQCQAAGIPFFYKQAPGGTAPKGVIETPELDGRRWIEFPRAKNSPERTEEE